MGLIGRSRIIPSRADFQTKNWKKSVTISRDGSSWWRGFRMNSRGKKPISWGLRVYTVAEAAGEPTNFFLKASQRKKSPLEYGRGRFLSRRRMETQRCAAQVPSRPSSQHLRGLLQSQKVVSPQAPPLQGRPYSVRDRNWSKRNGLIQCM